MRLHQDWCDDDGTPKWSFSEDLEKQKRLSLSSMRKSVIGSIIIGHDGLLIATTLSSDYDSKSVGESALEIYQTISRQ